MKKIISLLFCLININCFSAEIEDAKLFGDVKKETVNSITYLTSTTSNTNNYIIYKLFIPENGNYMFWFNLQSTNEATLSFSVDKGKKDLYDIPASTNWIWWPLNGRNGLDSTNKFQINPIFVFFSAGNHEFRMDFLTPNVKINKFLLTGNLWYLPLQKP